MIVTWASPVPLPATVCVPPLEEIVQPATDVAQKSLPPPPPPPMEPPVDPLPPPPKYPRPRRRLRCHRRRRRQDPSHQPELAPAMSVTPGLMPAGAGPCPRVVARCTPTTEPVGARLTRRRPASPPAPAPP